MGCYIRHKFWAKKMGFICLKSLSTLVPSKDIDDIMPPKSDPRNHDGHNLRLSGLKQHFVASEIEEKI